MSLLLPGVWADASAHKGYRRDIDGLRAIAVLSVVLYHFGVPGLTGGFVGVDVFFVISGYLIGGILWREYKQTGTISLWDFYIRRFRRLMPAFAVMAGVSGAVAWIVLLPFEFREFGKQIIAATVYLSNVLFFKDAGYFDTVSDEKVLLHTWSLAVEEQFYIVLPLLFLLLAKVRWLIVPTLIILFFASLIASVVLTPVNQPATFFLFPFRMWELLSGVLLAILGQRLRLSWARLGMLSYLGFVGIVVSVLFIKPNDMFPGYVVILPVAATLLLLGSGRADTALSRMLSTPLMVFFGLISYSLYLWHWPIFVFLNYLQGGEMSLVVTLMGLGLSVLCATVSWRLIELPVRRAAWLPRPVIFGGVVVTSLALLAGGGYIFKKDGLPERFGPEAQTHIAATADFLQDWSRCYMPTSGPLRGLETCPIGPEGDPQVLVWGDSHVRAFKEGLDLLAHETDTPGLIIWRAGCPPVAGVRKTESAATPAEDLACAQANLQITQSLGHLQSIERLILIGRWAYYFDGTGVGLDAGNSILVRSQGETQFLESFQSQVMAQALLRTVETIRAQGVTPFVLRALPEVAMYDSRLAARALAHDGMPFSRRPDFAITWPYAEALKRSRNVDETLTQVKARVLDPWSAICDDQTCSAVQNGTGFFFDNNHVTNSAALAMRSVFAPAFDGGGA